MINPEVFNLELLYLFLLYVSTIILNGESLDELKADVGLERIAKSNCHKCAFNAFAFFKNKLLL